jgi:hypothetical protein
VNAVGIVFLYGDLERIQLIDRKLPVVVSGIDGVALYVDQREIETPRFFGASCRFLFHETSQAVKQHVQLPPDTGEFIIRCISGVSVIFESGRILLGMAARILFVNSLFIVLF